MHPIDIADNIARVRDDISRFAHGRHVDLMLAAKHQPLERLAEAYNAGGTLMGHNLIDQLATSTEGLHNAGFFPITSVIGHVQSNKLSVAMQWADRIDTVDSLKTAQRINRRQEARLACGEVTGLYPILLQINSSGASTQFGCSRIVLLNWRARYRLCLPFTLRGDDDWRSGHRHRHSFLVCADAETSGRDAEPSRVSRRRCALDGNEQRYAYCH